MTRILFLPNPNTLLWLDNPLPAGDLLAAVASGTWLAPSPYETLDRLRLSAHLQDDVIIITLRAAPPSVAGTAAGAVPLLALSRRQREVLDGLASGLTTHQIALRLRLHPRSVMYHIAALKTLFNAQTRAELVHKAAPFH